MRRARGGKEVKTVGSGKNVRVGDDVAGGIDDEAGPYGALPAESQGRGAVVRGFHGAEAGDQYLHDARGHLLDQRIDGFIELAKGVVAALLSGHSTRECGDECRGCNGKKSQAAGITINHGNRIVRPTPTIE